MNEGNDQEQRIVPTLAEGRDFYFENGLMVLTAEYLRRRGYCCGNICRHCPYTQEEQAAALKKKFV
jgi:hypothetical protein